MAKKQSRTGGKYNYYRTKAKHPVTGEYRDVYGRTAEERDRKKAALEEAWAKEIRDAETPFFWQYAADWYSRVEPGLSPSRRTVIAREINNNLCPVIGSLRLTEITSDSVLDVLAARGDLSAASRTLTLQTLRRILEAAADAGKIARNPARNIKPGGRRSVPKNALTPAQQQTLLEAVKGLKIELFVKLGLYTGMRREELCGLTWGDVELDGAAPHISVRRACRWPGNNQPVVSEILKSDAAVRDIPLPAALAVALKAVRAGLGKLPEDQIRSRFVISNSDGSPWSMQTLTKAWGGIRARSTGTVTRKRKDPATGELVSVRTVRSLGGAVPKHPGVKISIDFPVTPHILRHTYVTQLILGGMDLKRVQYLAGHETPDVTLQIYTDLMGHQPEDLIDDIRRIFDDQ